METIDTNARLKSFIERIERLSEEKDGLQADIKDIYAEAKATGYEPKIMRKIIKMRKMTKDALMEEENLTDLYANAVGLI